MEERLAIIADDFTGAADAGVQFAARGRSCALVTSSASLETAEGRAEVVTFDTESRSLAPEAAAAAVRAAVAVLRAAGFDRFYKKIDSTLRGNLGAEIDALMEEAGCDLALVAPSAPRNLRTVVEGRCCVAGRPLATTEYAAGSGGEDASSVAAVIARQSRRPIASVGLAVVKEGTDALAERIAALRGEGAGIVVVDAATVEDLAIIAGAACDAAGGAPARGVASFRGALPPLLYVGSSGFAEALAAAESPPAALPQRPVHGDRPAPPAVGPAALAEEGPILFLVGSRSAVSQGQADELLRAGGVFETVVDPPEAVSSPARERDRIARAVSGRRDKGHVLVRVGARGGAASSAPDRHGGEKLIASFLGDLARVLLADERFSVVAATGGDTAVALAAAIELSALRLRGELLPGVVVSTASSLRLHRAITLVTKAGGFGEPDALRCAATRSTGEGR